MIVNRETNDGKKNTNITDGVNNDLMATRKVGHDTKSVHIMVAVGKSTPRGLLLFWAFLNYSLPYPQDSATLNEQVQK